MARPNSSRHSRVFAPSSHRSSFSQRVLLPANPALWQAFALVIHFLAAWAAWWCLDQIWPAHRQLTVSAAFLFLVFPGYSQHWVALTHINQEWISLSAYLLSLGLSVRALRHPATAIRATILALLLQLVGLLPTEYFATLEPLRALFFLSVLSGSIPERAPRARALLRAWWPYLVLWLLNAIWLMHFYRSGAYISYDLTAAAALPAPGEFLGTLSDALFKMAVIVWFQVIPLTAADLASPTSMGTWGVIVLAFGALAFYLIRLQPEPGLGKDAQPPTQRRRSDAHGVSNAVGWEAVVIGAVGMLLGRLPSYLAGLPLTLQSSFDRLTISMMLGAAVFMAGILHVLIAKSDLRLYVLAAMVALAVGQQFFNANIFRRDWQRQQEIYWQFAWRMPGILPDTAILAQQMPLDYETDLAMTAALNWMYAPAVEAPRLSLAVVYTEKRLGGVVLPALEPGLPMYMPLRTMSFHGNTSQVIAVYVPATGCLRVFDPKLDDARTYSRLPEAVTAIIPLSNLSRIITDASPLLLPSPPFSKEPRHGWCYIYEKAELARQDQDWHEILQLRQQAIANGLEPADAFEWLPFIEAESRAGAVSWAMEKTQELARSEPKLERGLCAVWSRVTPADSAEATAVRAKVKSELACDW